MCIRSRKKGRVEIDTVRQHARSESDPPPHRLSRRIFRNGPSYSNNERWPFALQRHAPGDTAKFHKNVQSKVGDSVAKLLFSIEQFPADILRRHTKSREDCFSGRIRIFVWCWLLGVDNKSEVRQGRS